MPIGLTDFIKPKNDAFTGIVQANQVLGGGGNGTLPNATVAVGNVTQHVASIDHTAIANVGTKTHAQIDTHIATSTDPHGSTLTQSVAVETPAMQNSGGAIAIQAVGDVTLFAIGNSNIHLNANNEIADSTVFVKNPDGIHKANLDVENNIIVGGTVDGRDVAADGTKLDTIEDNATADQSNAEIKTAYEANADTNEYSDAEQTKLAGIEATADVTDAANVNAAGAVMLTDVAAKGDIFVATADNVLTNLGVGSNGQVLKADSSEASGVKWVDVIDGITFNWPNPVTSPDPDEVPIGKVLPFAITLIHVRMHVVAGTGTVVFQIYDRAWDGSGSGTDSIKTTGDFSASTTASTITALVTALAAERQLIIKAISQTGSPTLVRVWIRYKLA